MHHRHHQGVTNTAAAEPQSGGANNGNNPAVFDPAAMMFSMATGGGNPLSNELMKGVVAAGLAAGKENASDPGLLLKYIPGTYVFRLCHMSHITRTVSGKQKCHKFIVC